MPNSNGPMTGTRNKLSNDPRNRGTSPPQRAINGQTGTVVGKQGDAFKVQISDGGKRKTLLVTAAHLRAQSDASED